MATYEEVSAVLRSRSDVEHGSGVSEREIVQAELSTGPLPNDYRSFLSEFGWVSFGFYEIWGLGEDLPHPSQNFVRSTLFERRETELSADMIAFHNDGGGDLACLPRASKTAPQGEGVYWYLHETRTLERDCDSFSDFIAQRLLVQPMDP